LATALLIPLSFLFLHSSVTPLRFKLALLVHLKVPVMNAKHLD